MTKKYILGVDVGTGSIKALVGMIEKGSVVVKGSGVVASAGISKGTITSIRELAVAIKEAIGCAAMAANVVPESVYLGIGGADLASVNSVGSVAPASTAAIARGDVERACRAAVAANVAEDHQVLHIVPICYWVDGEKVQKEPLGQRANRLEVETHMVLASRATIGGLTDALSKQGVHITGMMAGSIAGADVLAANAGETSDYLVIDIGAGATDLVLYNDNRICMSSSLPLGGDYITSDILQGIGVGWTHAEEIKRYYARLDRRLLGQEAILDCNGYGTTDKKVSYDFLSKVVESRVEEIVTIVYKYLEPALSRYPVNKILLTGGCSLLPSIAENVDKVFGICTLVSKPELPQEYSHPANTVCFGILCSAARLSHTEKDQDSSKRTLFDKIKKFI